MAEEAAAGTGEAPRQRRGRRPFASAAPPRQAADDVIEPSIYRFILRHSWREQLLLVILTTISFPVLYYSLQLPKTIINHAIGGKTFPQTVLGQQFGQIAYLLLLCTAFLLLVLLNGFFKYYVNVRKGQLGERMLRYLRYELYLRTLRFPLDHFQRTAGGQIIAMITAELEPVAGFIGDAFALPVLRGGTLVTVLVFMFVQDPVLGAAAVALYPVQGYIIPRLQRRVRAIGRERVRRIRGLSDRLTETIAARIDIRANDDAPWQLAEMAGRLREIYLLRYESYHRKYLAKSLSNFLGQLTPFLFYAIGGYFVIGGRLSFGALVAVLAAYQEMSDPWKELLGFYQDQQDVAIKYEQVVEQFDATGMIDRRRLLARAGEAPPLAGELVAANLAYRDADGLPRLEAVSFALPFAAHVAVVGPANGGKTELAYLLAGLVAPAQGRLTIGGLAPAELPLDLLDRRVGYVGPSTYLFDASLRDNLLVGLRHLVPSGDDAAADGTAIPPGFERFGTCTLDPAADWIDYRQAGVADAAGLTARMIDALRLVELDGDVYELGLAGTFDPAERPDEAARLVEARRRLAARLDAAGQARLVVRWAADRINPHASLGENLMFGKPIGAALAGANLARHPYVQRVLAEAGLTGDLLRLGREAATTMVELFGDGGSRDLADEYSLVPADELPSLADLVVRARAARPERLSAGDRARLLALALAIVPARHRFVELGGPLAERLLAARRRFAEELPEALRASVALFDAERYNPVASLRENLLLGTIAENEAGAREAVRALAHGIIEELHLADLVIAIGLERSVGAGGARLSPAQRQKVAVARAVLKGPDLLVLNEATAVLDGGSEARLLDRLRRDFAGRFLVCVLHDAGRAVGFDRILPVEGGHLAAAPAARPVVALRRSAV